MAEEQGYEIKTVKATIEVNENQKFRLMKKAKRRFKRLKGMKVAVLGLTFKPGTDDLREAPSIPNVKMLLEEGAEVHVYDPIGIEGFKKLFNSQVNYAEKPEVALENAEVAFIFTEWDEIKGISLIKFKELMKQAVVFDGRNCYSLAEAECAGVEYYSVGRRIVIPNKVH